MSFLTDDDRIPLTKQDRFNLEQVRLLEEIRDALQSNKKSTRKRTTKKEVVEDVIQGEHRTRRERQLAD